MKRPLRTAANSFNCIRPRPRAVAQIHGIYDGADFDRRENIYYIIGIWHLATIFSVSPEAPGEKYNFFGRRIMLKVAARLLRPLLFLVICSFIFSGQPNATAAETVRINGSGSGLDMMKPLIAAYAKAHPGVSFEMEKPLGSSGAIKALVAGAIDIAVTSKPLRPEESAAGAKVHLFGKTPLAIVVGQNVPIKNISTKELEDIYSGVMTKWPNGETIRAVLRPMEDIDMKILMGLSPVMDKAVTQTRNRRGMIIAVTDTESNEAVSKTIGGVGASGLTGIMIGKSSPAIVALNGVAPSTKSLADGSYPLAKDIHFVTTNKISNTARKFLDFIYSRKGRAIAEKTGVLVTATDKALK
jgi:phosphate transport system substrate-binding protein